MLSVDIFPWHFFPGTTDGSKLATESFYYKGRDGCESYVEATRRFLRRRNSEWAFSSQQMRTTPGCKSKAPSCNASTMTQHRPRCAGFRLVDAAPPQYPTQSELLSRPQDEARASRYE